MPGTFQILAPKVLLLGNPPVRGKLGWLVTFDLWDHLAPGQHWEVLVGNCRLN